MYCTNSYIEKLVNDRYAAKLEREVTQRRRAEQLQDKAESRARSAEGKALALREATTALHKELSLRGSAWYQEETEALEADLRVAKQTGSRFHLQKQWATGR